MIRAGLSTCAVAVGMLFSAGAYADAMSKNQYNAGNERIPGDYKSAKESCKSLSGNANDVCMKEAEARATIAKAELTAVYRAERAKPLQGGRHGSGGGICGGEGKMRRRAGNVKDVCVKQAKAAAVAAKADAEVQKKTANANDAADEKSDQAQGVADPTRLSRRKQRQTRRARSAQGCRIGQARCRLRRGEGEVRCVFKRCEKQLMDEAKARFGKS